MASVTNTIETDQEGRRFIGSTAPYGRNGTDGPISGRCTVCTNRKRGEIEALLTANTPLRKIAHDFGVSKDAARRHRAHIEPKANPLEADVAPCPYHGRAPFRFEGGQWVCGSCEPWDGSLAYWKAPSATASQA